MLSRLHRGSHDAANPFRYGFLMAIVLWAWTPLCWQPLWGQSPGVGVESSQDKKQQPALGANKANNNQRGTDTAPLIIETHARPDSPEEAAKHKAENDTKEYRDRWTFHLTIAGALFTGFLVILTGLLVIVGWRAVFAANRTLCAIERQAELMEASMTQWVSVVNWKVSVNERIGPLSKEPKRLLVEFEIANESNSPLTMELFFRFFAQSPKKLRFRTAEPRFLIPRKPYKFEVLLGVSQEQAAEYVTGALRIAVHGEISHTGVARQPSPLMSIRGNLVCGENVPTHLEYESVTMIPIPPKDGEQT